MELKSINSLLQYGKFKIPEYQRGYSWSNLQLSEFYEDLEDVDYVKEHYTGTITLIGVGEEKIGFTSYNLYEVVDGQQRLTTIFIFLSCLYAKLLSTNNLEASEDVKSHYMKKGKVLLELNNHDDNAFFSFLLNEQDFSSTQNAYQSKTQKNLIEAKKFFLKRLEKAKEKKLKILYNNLLTKFKVNIFELDSESEVGLVFETMNDRGLPLSDIDKVKNYLIYICHKLSDDDLARETNKKFGEIFRHLIKINETNVTKLENQFLKTAYMIYSGDTKDLSDIHKKIKQSLIPKHVIYKEVGQATLEFSNKKKDFIDDKRKAIKLFTSFLVKASQEYAKILCCEDANAEVRLELKKLKFLNQLDTFAPLLLAVSTNSNFKKEHKVKIIQLLEIYSVRVFGFCNKKSNTGISTLQDLAYHIRINKIKYREVVDRIKELIQKNGDNKDFRKAFVDENVYEKIHLNIIKYCLYEYENHLRTDASAVSRFQSYDDLFDNKLKVSVEHISPQTPLPSEKAYANLHTIGNLVLTFDNSILTNKTFPSKLKHYSNSDLLSERYLSKYEKWTSREISERGKIISKFALDRWKV